MDRYQHYEKLEKVGEGSYGVVYKARHRETGDLAALKQIRLELEDDGVPSTVIREVSILNSLKHPNIVKLLDAMLFVDEGKSRMYLGFEFLKSDLKYYIKALRPHPLQPMLMKSYLYQLLSGLAYCHKRRIIHRDLKPENLLLDSQGNLKIADFGLCRAFTTPIRTLTHEVVTLWYRSPEVLLGSRHYSLGLDIWAVGCIFAEMALAEPLFPGDSEIDQLFKIFRLLGTPTVDTWPGVNELPDFKPTFPRWQPQPLSTKFKHMDHQGLELLSRMLVYQPHKRISAKEALQHPYFDDIKILLKQKEEAARQQQQTSSSLGVLQPDTDALENQARKARDEQVKEQQKREKQEREQQLQRENRRGALDERKGIDVFGMPASKLQGPPSEVLRVHYPPIAAAGKLPEKENVRPVTTDQTTLHIPGKQNRAPEEGGGDDTADSVKMDTSASGRKQKRHRSV